MPFVVHFKRPAGWAADIRIHFWDATPAEPSTQWPGVPMTAEVNDWPEVPDIDRDDRGPIPRVNVSVKLSALYSQFDPIDPDGTSKDTSEEDVMLLAVVAAGRVTDLDAIGKPAG